MRRYQLNPDSEIPVYRQLTDQINAEIRSGMLKNGTQLPTVREMAEQTRLSCGTVKRVYDRLREMGVVEMTRRRGTFVKYVREDGDSRKTAAMTAIDQMIRRLTELRFSPAEIQIFLNLKMREWGLKWSGIRAAVIAPCGALSGRLEAQVGALGNVNVIGCGIAQLREYPYSVDEQADVILASEQDAQTVLPLLPDPSKLIKVAITVRRDTIAQIARHSGARFGVLPNDADFLRVVRAAFPEERFEPNCGDAEVLIVPEEWRELTDEDMRACPAAHPARIEFGCEIDAGSMIYLEERIGRIRDERKIQPGALTF